MSKPVGEMNFKELSAHINEKEKTHRREMKHLRALLRVVADRNDSEKANTQDS